MDNYLKKEKFKRIDIRDYSLSNNNIGDEYKLLKNKMNYTKLLELVSRYPDYRYSDLIKILKRTFKINNVVLGNGSEDLIMRMNLALKDRGGVAILLPNFYRVMETAGKYQKIYTHYNLDSEFLDIKPIFPQIDKSIRALWISNPNPMIGKVYKKEQLLRLIKKYPNVLFIIDESAIDFIENSSKVSVIDTAQILNNLIVIRSFSKLYGLAGLRAGFATGKSKTLNRVKDFGLTFPINKVADYFIKIILEDKSIFSRIRKRITKNRLLIKNLLSQDKDIVFNKSVTNCLFFSDKKRDIFSELLKFEILSLKLNDCEGVKEKDFVRMTIHGSESLHRDLSLRLSRFIKSRKRKL